jgi:hypothetical protein
VAREEFLVKKKFAMEKVALCGSKSFDEPTSVMHGWYVLSKSEILTEKIVEIQIVDHKM